MAGPSEDSLRRLLEETTLLAAITDDRDRIIYANAALARLVGKHPADVVGSRWTGTFGSSSADDKFMNDLREGRVLRFFIEQQHRPAVFLILLRHVIGDFGEGLGRAMPTETGIPVH